MKYAITPDTDIVSIPKDASELHFVRPVALRNLKKLLRKCRGLQQVSLSESCSGRFPEKARKMLEQKNIAIKFSSNRGRAIGLDIEMIKEIVGMQRDEKSFREIEELTRIPKSTAHYLIRYAERTKVKSGNNVVYLGDY